MAHTAKKTVFLSAAAIMLGILYLSPAQAGNRDRHSDQRGDRYTNQHQYRSDHRGHGQPTRYYGRPAYNQHHHHMHRRHHWKHRHYNPYVRYYSYYPSPSYGISYAVPGYRVSIDYGY